GRPQKSTAWMVALASLVLVVDGAQGLCEKGVGSPQIQESRPDSRAGAENWPGFRGPTGLGYTQDRSLPLTWGGAEHTNVLWQAPLKGQGHASPIVWQDRVFVCTASWPAAVQQREKVIPEHHVTCYHTTDGKLLWDTLIPPGPW